MSAVAADTVNPLARIAPPAILAAFASIDASVLAWLVLAPVWPEEIACQGFASNRTSDVTGEPVSKLLELAFQQGLLLSLPGQTPWRGRWFTFKPTLRTRAVEYLLNASNGGVHFFEQELRRMGRVLSAPTQRGFPPALNCFVQLASAAASQPNQSSDRSMAQVLEAQVRTALALGRERKDVSFPAAERWIDAATLLESIFSGELKLAMERARRRLELSERRGRDRRFLDSYTPRKTLQDAFLEMLDSRADQSWALHYLGDGGMGKTMLIRQITGPIADDEKLITSRVDFDHINPDYPSRAPGLLLLALAEELKLYEDNSVAEQLEKFDRVINEAQIKVEEATRLGLIIGSDIKQRLKEAEERFVEVLQNISRSKRVVLILDTCEELARIRVDGQLSDAVIQTFAVLERIHAQVPSLRVVFSGRRNLASKGFGGWQLPEPPPDIPKLPPRDFLRRAVVTGFDRAESEQFFEHFRNGKSPVPVTVREKIREMSVVTRAPADISEQRFNPYDLNLYAAWVSEEQSEPLSLLTAESHHYVRERIIGRLNEWMRPWLPYLAKLGEFDRKMLRDIIDEPAEQFATVMQEITAQEWVHRTYGAQWDGQSPDQVLQVTWHVDAKIAQRVLEYYSDPNERRDEWPQVLKKLREVLSNAVIERPWSELTPEYFVVALELMATQPEEAADWWRKVEAKILGERAWAWGLQICRELQGREWHPSSPLAAANGQNLVWAAVAGTECALKTKQGTEGHELQSAWSGMLQRISPDADSPAARRLRYRALAGAASAARWLASPVTENYLHELEDAIRRVPAVPDPADMELLATEVGFIDNVVEIIDQLDWRGVAQASLVECIDSRIDAVSQRLLISWRDFLQARRARVYFHAGRKNYAESLPTADRDRDEIHASVEYLDWRQTADLNVRILLEIARIRRWNPTGNIELLKHALVDKVAFVSEPSINRDRAHSLDLRSLADWILPDDVPDEWIETSLALAADAKPECVAHREIPPLFQTALEIRAERGRGHEVLKLCDALAQDSTRTLGVRQAAERIKTYIATRWRLVELGVARQTSLQTSPGVEDRLLVAGAQAYDPLAKPYCGRWTQVLEALVVEKIRPAGWHNAVEEWHLRCDALETEDSTQPTRGYEHSPGYPEPWKSDRRFRTSVAGIAAMLRRWANTSITDLDLACGGRLAASIALEEAGLMALRAPQSAERLFEYAVKGFQECRDPLGVLLALGSLAMIRSGRLEGNKDLEALEAAIQNAKQSLGLGLGLATNPHVLSAPLPQDPAASAVDFWRPWTIRFELAVRGAPKGPALRPELLAPPDIARVYAANDDMQPGEVLASDSSVADPPTPRFLWSYLVLAIVFLLIGLTVQIAGQWILGSMNTGDPLGIDRSRDLSNYIAGVSVVLAGIFAILAFTVHGADSAVWEKVWSKLGSALGMIFSLLFFLGGMWWLYRGYEWLLRRAHLELTSGQKVGLLAAVVAVIVLLSKGYVRAMHFLLRSAQVRYFVHALSEKKFTIDANVAMRTNFGIHRGPWTSDAFELADDDDTAEYRKSVTTFAPGKLTVGERTDFSLVPSSVALDFVLEVPHEMAGLPWEAMLSVPRKKSEIRWKFRRSGESREVTSAAGAFAGPMRVDIGWSARGVSAIRDVWLRALQNDSRFRLNTDLREAADATARAGIVYVNDEVRDTSRGLTIEPGDGRELFPSEFVRAYPDVRLVILQLPIRANAQRHGHDRKDAARARQLAAQLFAAGVPAVLVLPSLTHELAIRALRDIVALIARRPKRTARALANQVNDIATTIANQLQPPAGPWSQDHEAALETPFDLCFYCRDDLSLAIKSG